MPEELAPHGPFTVKLEIAGTTPDGDQATITVGLPPGEVPTTESIRNALDDAEKQLQGFGEGCRLLGRHEFINRLIAERTGSDERIHIPWSDAWSVPA